MVIALRLCRVEGAKHIYMLKVHTPTYAIQESLARRRLLSGHESIQIGSERKTSPPLNYPSTICLLT